MLNESKIFWDNLERIKDYKLIDDEKLCALLGMSLPEFRRFKKVRAFLPLDAIYQLAENYNFHFEDLLNSNFVLKEDALPLMEKYRKASYSGVLPLRNIVNYVEVNKGLRAKTNLLRKFQLTDDFFMTDGYKTNIHLITDMNQFLGRTYNLKQEDFINMGRRSPFLLGASKLGQKLSQQKTILETVTYFIEECTKLFDHNNKYTVESIRNGFVTIADTPHNDVLIELGIRRHQFSNPETCFTKMGVISSLSYFKQKKHAPISKISSILQGDPANRYVIDLNGLNFK